uniref:Delta-like protein n=2 Tax=Macrostomum lignano TaxID=282301 RepID=A0A1I8FXI3_9PLAT
MASHSVLTILMCALILVIIMPVTAELFHNSNSELLSRQRRAVCNPDCKNGGVCVTVNGKDMCLCSLPYTGQTCTVIIDYCTTAQPEIGIDPKVAPVCLNGTCLGTVLTEPYFNCSCLPGFNGTRCENNIDDCATNPCINGLCKDLINNYTCSCYQGWQGRHCSANINDCFAGACLNGGQCIDGNSSYTCNCSDTGFRGANCSENIDDCASPSNPCSNGGVCIDGVKNYTCQCLAGYSGRNCTVDEPDCSPNPCHYNGTCLERSNQALYGNASLPYPFDGVFNYSAAAGFVCLCPNGSSGNDCSINPNDCLDPATNRSLCAHASSCTDGLASFTCHCLPGYEGPTCSIDINECERFGQPCQNGAVCKDLVADYACTGCTAEFGGKNCSVRLTGCDSSPCENNATCEPLLLRELPSPDHGYRCTCKPGWSGPQCNENTLASFNGTSSFSANFTTTADCTFELSFRTSLAHFDLVRLSSHWGDIRVGAHDSSLVLLLFNASSSLI